MKLQSRDIDIINYLEEFKGATIEHIQGLFFPSYDSAKKRLKILEDDKQIKGCWHQLLGKKVYFIDKLPSYHRIITNEVRLAMLKNFEVLEFKYEAQIKNFKVDALCVYKSDKVGIIIIEVDIYNRTSEEKIKFVENEIKNKTNIIPQTIVVGMHVRKHTRAINAGVRAISEVVEGMRKKKNITK